MVSRPAHSVGAAAGRFGIKPGYRENEPSSFDRDPEARYWTEQRIEASGRYQHPVYRVCRELLRSRAARSFLDVGSGPGTKVAELIAPLCRDLTLVDQPSSREIALRCVPGACFIAADLDDLDLDLERSFDLIVCADVLEHLKHPDACLDFIREHLAEGGRAVLSTPERDNLRGHDCMESPHPEHVREWNAAEFRAFVESCRLHVEGQILLPAERTHPLELALSRRLARFVLRRRWGANQVLVCRRADSR
jgi:SAM-dependent methyltransferase